MIEARAASSAAFARLSFSLASAVSIAGRAEASRDLNTALAAVMRLAGSSEMMSSEPAAAWTIVRRRLFSRTAFRPAGAAETSVPLFASNSLPDASR